MYKKEVMQQLVKVIYLYLSINYIHRTCELYLVNLHIISL